MIERLTSVAEAWERLQEAFSRHSTPHDVSYCPCCFEESEMQRVLRAAPSDLTAEDLEPILSSAYLTWGNWPSFAFYVPRLLQLYASDELPDADLFFYKLLWAARPELLDQQLFAAPLLYIGEVMPGIERSSIFQFVQAVATAELRNPDLTSGTDRLKEALGFLTAFDVSIAPLLQAWQATAEPVARGRFCLLLAEYALRYDPAHPFVANTYLGSVPILPENADALAALVDPGFVAAYLADHAADAALFGSDDETWVGLAFDWATTALRMWATGELGS